MPTMTFHFFEKKSKLLTTIYNFFKIKIIIFDCDFLIYFFIKEKTFKKPTTLVAAHGVQQR